MGAPWQCTDSVLLSVWNSSLLEGPGGRLFFLLLQTSKFLTPSAVGVRETVRLRGTENTVLYSLVRRSPVLPWQPACTVFLSTRIQIRHEDTVHCRRSTSPRPYPFRKSAYTHTYTYLYAFHGHVANKLEIYYARPESYDTVQLQSGCSASIVQQAADHAASKQHWCTPVPDAWL